MMRILHLIHSEGIYGAERILLYLAREQQRSGLDAVIGSIRDPGCGETPFEARARSWGLSVVPVRIPPRPTPGAIRGLLRAARQVGADVLHSHGYKANIMLGPLPGRQRAPMVATLHGWTSAAAFSRLWVYESLDRLALRRIERVVVVARPMLELAALRRIPRARLQVIENGIPPLPERLADLAAQGVGALPRELVDFVTRRPTLVATGRLSTEKGYTILLDAFSRSRVADSGAQLLIVGEGPESERLARQIGVLGLGGSVRLAGYVEGADRLLEQARGFVMSSLTEGMPLVLLEALQWGVPVLATAVGAIPGLLAHRPGSILVPPGDPDALATGVRQLLATARARAGAASAGASGASHDSAQMAREYLAAYRAVSSPP